WSWLLVLSCCCCPNSIPAIHGQHGSTYPLPISLVAAILPDFRQWCDVGGQDCVLVVTREADGRTPAKAEPRSAKAPHCFGRFGIEVELADEFIELLPVEHRRPLAVLALRPPAFQVAVLAGAAFGLLPQPASLWWSIVTDADAVRNGSGIDHGIEQRMVLLV